MASFLLIRSLDWKDAANGIFELVQADFFPQQSERVKRTVKDISDKDGVLYVSLGKYFL